jgi:hypothetical protein
MHRYPFLSNSQVEDGERMQFLVEGELVSLFDHVGGALPRNSDIKVVFCDRVIRDDAVIVLD